MEPILRAHSQVDSVLSADGRRPARRSDDAGLFVRRQAGSQGARGETCERDL